MGFIFKRGVRVIVQAAHQTVIDRILDAHRRQQFLHFGEMRRAFFIQAVQDGRSIGKFLLIHLAVEHAHWIALNPGLTVLAQIVLHRHEETEQFVAIGCPARRIADRVQLYLDLLQAKLPAVLVTKRDNLGIDRRINCAYRFHPELVELPLASRLRALIAEHRAGIIQLRYVRLPVQFVLYIRANDSCRSFRPKRHAAVALIGERVHFFLDNIRRFPNAAFKQ
ncbi:hypothetical protein D3C77_314160 [compost metagenome]